MKLVVVMMVMGRYCDDARHDDTDDGNFSGSDGDGEKLN